MYTLWCTLIKIITKGRRLISVVEKYISVIRHAIDPPLNNSISPDAMDPIASVGVTEQRFATKMTLGKIVEQKRGHFCLEVQLVANRVISRYGLASHDKASAVLQVPYFVMQIYMRQTKVNRKVRE